MVTLATVNADVVPLYNRMWTVSSVLHSLHSVINGQPAIALLFYRAFYTISLFTGLVKTFDVPLNISRILLAENTVMKRKHTCQQLKKEEIESSSGNNIGAN